MLYIQVSSVPTETEDDRTEYAQKPFKPVFNYSSFHQVIATAMSMAPSSLINSFAQYSTTFNVRILVLCRKLSSSVRRRGRRGRCCSNDFESN